MDGAELVLCTQFLDPPLYIYNFTNLSVYLGYLEVNVSVLAVPEVKQAKLTLNVPDR